MDLAKHEVFPGLFELLHNALAEGITPQRDENRVRVVLMSWLSEHGIEMFRIYEDKHPIQFIYSHDGTRIVQIELFLEHGGNPVTITAGIPPSGAAGIRPANNVVDDAWPAQ